MLYLENKGCPGFSPLALGVNKRLTQRSAGVKCARGMLVYDLTVSGTIEFSVKTVSLI